jgi:hypothetical protein
MASNVTTESRPYEIPRIRTRPGATTVAWSALAGVAAVLVMFFHEQAIPIVAAVWQVLEVMVMAVVGIAVLWLAFLTPLFA